MDRLERILSRPAAKPYRSKAIKDEGPPHLNADGHVDFKENDIESQLLKSFDGIFCRVKRLKRSGD